MNKNPEETPYDEEPKNVQPTNQQDIGIKKGAYTKLKRDLDEEEMTSKGALKLILNDLDRLEREVAELSKFRDDYHDINVKYNVNTEQLKSVNSREVFQSIVLTIGGAILGITPSVWSLNNIISVFLALVSIVLLIGVLIVKFGSKNEN